MADEFLCLRCGRCCVSKVRVSPESPIYALTDVPCPHLDTGSKLCRVYEKRYLVCGLCLSVEQALAKEALPIDCPYVRASGLVATGYRGPKFVKVSELPPEVWRTADRLMGNKLLGAPQR